MNLHTPDLPAHPRLRAFVEAMQPLLESAADEATVLRQGAQHLGALVAHDDWLPEAFAQPNPERYQQFLLYADPQDRFSVVSFVWGPGQSTPIHDHTVWGLIGMLRGQELTQPFARTPQGRWAPSGAQIRLLPGEVERVSPTLGDVHKVWNGLPDQASISIHVYGANIGKVRRHVFHEDGTVKDFVSGYSNPPRPVDGPVPTMNPAQVRERLLARQEICILDVREEDPFAQAHPLFAANLPLSRIELDAWRRIPRRDTCLVVYDAGEGLVEPAVRTLRRIGYTNVHALAGGLAAWRESGGELFRDVNVPSKSFGELVESVRHTPSLSAQEVKALIDQQADMVVLDARRFDEYQTMSIPTGVSVPGAELVLRARALAPNPSTRIVVNCAGRTRSIIGTQSLINAGLPNPVSALRNGTIGWTLAGQALARGASARFPTVDARTRAQAAQAARAVADRAGVARTDLATVLGWLADNAGVGARSTYFFDVRTPEEFAAGHVPGACSAPGGQLVQETDHSVAVRGARVVLCDDDGTRANMSASWLAQMGWEVHVVDGLQAPDFSAHGPALSSTPEPPVWVRRSSAAELADWLASDASATAVLDLGTSAAFVQGHIRGARWALRSQLASARAAIGAPPRLVLVCAEGRASRQAVADVRGLWPASTEVCWLDGGLTAWVASGQPLVPGEEGLLSPRIDRYRRPYEGTDNPVEAMQGYLDWEFGLVEQLGRDGTHHFRVI